MLSSSSRWRWGIWSTGSAASVPKVTGSKQGAREVHLGLASDLPVPLPLPGPDVGQVISSQQQQHCLKVTWPGQRPQASAGRSCAALPRRAEGWPAGDQLAEDRLRRPSQQGPGLEGAGGEAGQDPGRGFGGALGPGPSAWRELACRWAWCEPRSGTQARGAMKSRPCPPGLQPPSASRGLRKVVSRVI